MRRNHLFILAALMAAVTVLTACSSSDTANSSGTTQTTVSGSTASTDAPTTTAAATASTDTTAAPDTTAPAVVTAGCNWESARLSSDVADDAPSDEGTDLATAILGSWQHTHINEGSGFVPVKPTTDIRFVLTSDRFLYCQDVEGVTEQAENSAPLNLEGNELVLPSPATGYAVTAWDEHTMIWLNHRDGSLYLLRRR